MGSVAEKLLALERLEHPSPEDIIERKVVLDAISKQWSRVQRRIFSEYKTMTDACNHYAESQKEDSTCFIVRAPTCVYCGTLSVDV